MKYKIELMRHLTIAEYRTMGYIAEVIEVSYHFQKGVNQILIIKRKGL